MQETHSKSNVFLNIINRIAIFLYTLGCYTYDGTVLILKKLYRITGLRSLFKYLAPVLPKDNLPQFFSHSVRSTCHRILSVLTGASASVFEDTLSPKAKKKYAFIAVKRVATFLIPVVIMCSATVFVIRLQDYISAVNVVINGDVIATVEEPQDFYDIESYVANYVQSLTGEKYKPDYNVSLRATVAYGPSLKDEEEVIRDRLLEEADEQIVQSYGLYVDGNLVMTNHSPDTLNGMLDSLKDAYLEGTGKNAADGEQRTVAFIQDVSVLPTYVSATAQEAPPEDEFIQKIVSPIAASTSDKNITNELLSNFDETKIYQALGENPNAKSMGMPISVKVVQNEEYKTYQSYSTERIPDSSLTKGATKVVQKGSKGVTKVVDEVYIIDGKEVSRATISKTVVSEPVKQIVHYGTKVSVVTGKFKRPVVGGSITSYYGYRRSGFHTGIDIARPTGTKIYAADGGTVTFAGRSGGYGLLIKIDHGNGYSTYYAHCSALSVKKGQQVNKGDVIGKVGSTGNSTGSHLHFEVRLHGNTKNPLNYVSSR